MLNPIHRSKDSRQLNKQTMKIGGKREWITWFNKPSSSCWFPDRWETRNLVLDFIPFLEEDQIIPLLRLVTKLNSFGLVHCGLDREQGVIQTAVTVVIVAAAAAAAIYFRDMERFRSCASWGVLDGFGGMKFQLNIFIYIIYDIHIQKIFK